MLIEFPSLPYSLNALEPFISKRTLEFHYGKHHKTYVSKLNELIKDTAYSKMELKDIVLNSFQHDQDIFNNAAQAWNHNFYWHCMTNKSHNEISSDCLALVIGNFGSLENLKFKFIESAKKLFGSGWTWLVAEKSGHLSIQNFKDADTPIAHDLIPILACDVWEHAYYLDHQNERNNYLNNYWELVDWGFVEENAYKIIAEISKNSSNESLTANLQ